MQDLGIISPGLEEFRELAGHSRVIPVRLKVLADAETPIGLYRKLAQGQPGTFLMESAAVGGSWSRYSFIGARSRATLTTKDGQAHWLGEPPVGVPLGGSPVDAIRDTVEALRTDRFEDLPPFTSGLVGFLGWETVRHWEKLTSPPEDDLELPEMALNLVTDMAVHDNMDGTVLLIANAINFDNSSERVDEAWHDAVARVKALLAQISTPVKQPVSVLDPAALDFASSVQERWDETRLPRRPGPQQGSNRRRRSLPGGHLAPLRNGMRRGPAGRLPGAPEHQPQPLHVHLQPRGRQRPAVLDRRFLPGGARDRDGRGSHHPPHRRFPAARQNRGGRQGPGRGTPRGREGARRTPDAGGSLPQRPVQGLRGWLRRRHPVHGSRALQPHHAPCLHRGRASWRPRPRPTTC